MLIDNLEEGKTISGEYYASLMDRLQDTIKAERPHFDLKNGLYSE